jgi:hypothetical protein
MLEQWYTYNVMFARVHAHMYIAISEVESS